MAQEINPGGEILILDDDAAVRAALSMVFSREGYRVQCFLDSHSFLAAARARIPACIILDVHIPGRSGLEVLKELNAESYPAPIFIISGRGDIPMAVDAIKHGAFDFVEKPFRGSDVVARVREAIEALTRRQANNSVSDKYSFGLPSGAETPDPAGMRGAAPARGRRLQQGSGPPIGNQPTHRRSSSCPHHGKGRSQEYRRPHPHGHDRETWLMTARPRGQSILHEPPLVQDTAQATTSKPAWIEARRWRHG
jgi:ActR/RegA family two-component response regulator